MCILINLANISMQTRNMLILQDKENLEEQQVWLCQAYEKIVSNIVKIASDLNSSIDPFASDYIGKNSIKMYPNYYNALLEVTSYFWASKGGRGTLLQKTIGLLAGDKADENIYLSEYLDELIKSDETLNGKLSIKFRKKFDLINRVNDTLIILEIKNRIDSGGTSGRREALKKFFELCDSVESNTIAFTDSKSKTEYTLPKLFEKLGIKKFEMLMGLFYNIKGSEANLIDDKKNGFYSESKSLVTKYANEHLGIKHDAEKLKINFDKDEIKFVIQTVYGSDSTKRFTANKLTLDHVLESVFSKSWDDIWLAVNTGIEQRRILLEHKINHITEIQRLYKTNSNFEKELKKFKLDSNNLSLTQNIVIMIEKNIDPKLSKSLDQDVTNALYLCSRFIK